MYRSTPHSTTGVSPAELLFNRKLRTKLPQLEKKCILMIKIYAYDYRYCIIAKILSN